MPKVYNKHVAGYPVDAVYVGRPSEWGNPFVLNEYSDRDKVVAQYEEYMSKNLLLQRRAREKLKGKDLVCWCAPRSCHADILLRIANE